MGKTQGDIVSTEFAMSSGIAYLMNCCWRRTRLNSISTTTHCLKFPLSNSIRLLASHWSVVCKFVCKICLFLLVLCLALPVVTQTKLAGCFHVWLCVLLQNSMVHVYMFVRWIGNESCPLGCEFLLIFTSKCSFCFIQSSVDGKTWSLGSA
jgi:hypothetical protein